MIGIFSVQGVNHDHDGGDFISDRRRDIVMFRCGLWSWRSQRELRDYVEKNPRDSAEKIDAFDDDIYAWPVLDDHVRRDTSTCLQCLCARVPL